MINRQSLEGARIVWDSINAYSYASRINKAQLSQIHKLECLLLDLEWSLQIKYSEQVTTSLAKVKRASVFLNL